MILSLLSGLKKKERVAANNTLAKGFFLRKLLMTEPLVLIWW